MGVANLGWVKHKGQRLVHPMSSSNKKSDTPRFHMFHTCRSAPKSSHSVVSLCSQLYVVVVCNKFPALIFLSEKPGAAA